MFVAFSIIFDSQCAVWVGSLNYPTYLDMLRSVDSVYARRYLVVAYRETSISNISYFLTTALGQQVV